MGRAQIGLCGAVVAGLLLAACAAGGAVDRTGGDTVVLQFATIDGALQQGGTVYGPAAFVEQLEIVSNGRLRVEVSTGYGDGAADAESRLVEAISSGDLDGGWPATRAFGATGIRGLEVVEAPMALASYDAQRELVSGTVAEELLAGLDGSGVVGLGMAVGPLRRPFAREAPLLGVEDWEDARFRTNNSEVQRATVNALGGTAADIGFGWIDEVRTGTLRGGEFDVMQYAANGYTTEAGNATANVVLWPKVFVLSLSEQRFTALNEEQQGWVRQAAEQATRASIDAAWDESAVAADLCGRGVRFLDATQAQLEGLRAAVQPVIDDLRGSYPDLMDGIEGIARAHPDADQPKVPADCRAPAEGQDGSAVVPDEVSELPDGVYRVEISEDEVTAAGLSNGPGWSGTWTLTIREGTYQLTCRPLDRTGHDCGNTVSDAPLEAGQLRGTGDVAHFVYDVELMSRLTGCTLPASETEAGHCYLVSSYVYRWQVEGDQLELFDAGSEFEAPAFTLKPWTRIT